ncbi:uncharacterized protein OCT59_019618 [Rhizophagus irregularis]|uniref:uncharacterized protein n=1 Tax=Rhizophagus irregularis TaxID=588596 RepID=UPI00331AF0FE|nr:hypothetical protein OCT59_019618 [Rhizophagus irregularis]
MDSGSNIFWTVRRPGDAWNWNLESCICSCSEWVRNLSKANTIASQALRHSPKNNTAPSQRYTIVNYRPRGMPYDQANTFMFFDEN